MKKHDLPVTPRILVADDMRDLADVYGCLFSSAGFDVARAYDGHTAAALALATEPDVAILNQDLPGRTGLAVMHELRAAGARTKVVISGGGGGFRAMAERALAEGAAFCVRQPCHAEQLLLMVGALLARPRGFRG